jgi:hypothetical protein
VCAVNVDGEDAGAVVREHACQWAADGFRAVDVSGRIRFALATVRTG